MYSKARFDTCPVCGEHVDLDEHTECSMVSWSVSVSSVVEQIRAETPEAAACRYVELRDSTCTDGTIGVAERSGVVIVAVTNVESGRNYAIVIAGGMEPTYEAMRLETVPMVVAIGNPFVFEY